MAKCPLTAYIAASTEASKKMGTENIKAYSVKWDAVRGNVIHFQRGSEWETIPFFVQFPTNHQGEQAVRVDA